MRRQAVALERLKNTLWRTVLAFIPSLAHPDDAYARSLLQEAEYGLYMAMDRRDRVHACAVATRLGIAVPRTSPELLRAALLHDVGKTGSRYNPFMRVFVALYTPKNIRATPRLTGLRGAWQVKRHHDAFGAALIRGAGGSESARVAEIVARHHQPGTDADAAALREADARF